MNNFTPTYLKTLRLIVNSEKLTKTQLVEILNPFNDLQGKDR